MNLIDVEHADGGTVRLTLEVPVEVLDAARAHAAEAIANAVESAVLQWRQRPDYRAWHDARGALDGEVKRVAMLEEEQAAAPEGRASTPVKRRREVSGLAAALASARSSAERLRASLPGLHASASASLKLYLYGSFKGVKASRYAAELEAARADLANVVGGVLGRYVAARDTLDSLGDPVTLSRSLAEHCPA